MTVNILLWAYFCLSNLILVKASGLQITFSGPTSPNITGRCEGKDHWCPPGEYCKYIGEVLLFS